jgi:hypothetical protein
MNQRRGRFYLTRWLAVGIVLAAAQLACSLTGAASTSAAPTQKAATTEAAGGITSTPAEATQASGAEPTATQQKAAGGGGGGEFACFGTAEHGVTCLTGNGWKTYTTGNSFLKSNGVDDMTACPDGKIYAVTSTELGVFDGETWQTIFVEGFGGGAQYVACGPDGSVWVGYYKGLGRYQNGDWKNFTSDQYASGEFSGLINGLGVTPDGKVWVANSDSISAYDGTSWKEYKQGAGFDDRVDFTNLAVDSKNRVWATSENFLYMYANGQWKKIEMQHYYQVNSLAVDPQDRLWINTDGLGAVIFDGTNWSGLSYKTGEIHSNGVWASAFDSSGRTWLGLAYGIDILVGGTWTHFRMDNADLADNQIKNLAVVGNGPALPAPMTKKLGSIAGHLSKAGAPVPNAQMELCVEMGLTYTGETPCSGQPFMKKITTAADGKFSVADLPVGFYVLTLKMDDGSWVQLGRVLVQEGQATDVGELKVSVS